jgi:hypothetical protein
MDTLRIYFDTNLLQYASYALDDEAFEDVLAEDRSSSFMEKVARHGSRWSRNMKALRFILDADDQLPLVFVTSKLTLREIRKAPEGKRLRMTWLYKALRAYRNPNGWPRPFGRLDSNKVTPERLEKILPHRADAEHVYYSLIRRCNVFLTGDYKSILEHARKLRACGVNAKSPYQLVVAIYGRRLWAKGAGLALS